MDPNTTTSALQLLGFVLGVAGFLIAMKSRVDKAVLEAANRARVLSLRPSFETIFFWAVVWALLGGALWATLQAIAPNLVAYHSCVAGSTADPSLGGSSEPSGLGAFLWPIVTVGPGLGFLCLLAWRGVVPGLTGRQVAGTSIPMLCGLGLASALFYNAPLSAGVGVRCFFAGQSASPEIPLSFLWSLMLTSGAYIALWLGRRDWRGSAATPRPTIWSAGEALVMTFALTWLAIMLFLLLFPGQEHESARGMLAGLALRVSLWFGLVVATLPVPNSFRNPIHPVQIVRSTVMLTFGDRGHSWLQRHWPGLEPDAPRQKDEIKLLREENEKLRSTIKRIEKAVGAVRGHADQIDDGT